MAVPDSLDRPLTKKVKQMRNLRYMASSVLWSKSAVAITPTQFLPTAGALLVTFFDTALDDASLDTRPHLGVPIASILDGEEERIPYRISKKLLLRITI